MASSSSPSRKNPKKAGAAIAHTTTLSGLADTTRAPYSLAITWAVIESLMRGGVPLSILMRLMPACTPLGGFAKKKSSSEEGDSLNLLSDVPLVHHNIQLTDLENFNC